MPLNELNDQTSPARPEWASQNTGDFTIRRFDFSDENFVRKSVWEASEGQKKRFNVWAYNGKKMSAAVSVVGNSKGIPVIAKAMLTLFPNCPAYFIGGPNQLILISLDGQLLKKPYAIDHVSFNANPMNDWNLMRDLPAKLDKIRGLRNKPDSVASIKAWMNVESGDVVTFPANHKFEKPLVADPGRFGVQEAKSILQARITAERNGWIAFGVNAEEEGNVVAVVQAMNEAMAKKGARAMYDIRKVKWSVLKVVTNDGSKTYKGEDEIAAYCSKQTEFVDI